MKNKAAKIELESDGWTIICDGKTYRYNHNTPDHGVSALEVLLTDLGLKVEIEESY